MSSSPSAGRAPCTQAERGQRRREAWELLRLFTHIAVAGRRRAYRPTKGEPDILATWGPLIALIEVADGEGQLALDGSRPPREATLVAGPWLERITKEHPEFLPDFGNALVLGRLPDKPRHVWAKGIGWALTQRIRVNAARQGSMRYFTRRELLDYLNPEPHYAEILASNKPRRAVALWDAAIALLKEHGVIGSYNEIGPAPWKRAAERPGRTGSKPQGWQEAWLDQKLDIRPGVNGEHLLSEVRAKATEARKARR